MLKIKSLLSFLLFLSFTRITYSQTIINAERIGNSKDSSVYALSFSYYGTRGNANVNRFSTSPVVKFTTKNHQYKAFGKYAILSNSNSNILNSAYLHIRHNYKLSKRFKTYEFYQIQFNEILLLEKREILGFGLRYAVINKDSLNLSAAFGLMHEYEQLNQAKLLSTETRITNYYRGSGILTFNWINSQPISLHNVLYFQPRLTDFEDFRLLNEFNLVFKLSTHFSFLLELTTRYDSKPPNQLKGIDHRMDAGINLKF